jgi:hypothetical protein
VVVEAGGNMAHISSVGAEAVGEHSSEVRRTSEYFEKNGEHAAIAKPLELEKARVRKIEGGRSKGNTALVLCVQPTGLRVDVVDAATSIPVHF